MAAVTRPSPGCIAVCEPQTVMHMCFVPVDAPTTVVVMKYPTVCPGSGSPGTGDGSAATVIRRLQFEDDSHVSSPGLFAPASLSPSLSPSSSPSLSPVSFDMDVEDNTAANVHGRQSASETPALTQSSSLAVAVEAYSMASGVRRTCVWLPTHGVMCGSRRKRNPSILVASALHPGTVFEYGIGAVPGERSCNVDTAAACSTFAALGAASTVPRHRAPIAHMRRLYASTDGYAVTSVQAGTGVHCDDIVLAERRDEEGRDVTTTNSFGSDCGFGSTDVASWRVTVLSWASGAVLARFALPGSVPAFPASPAVPPTVMEMLPGADMVASVLADIGIFVDESPPRVAHADVTCVTPSPSGTRVVVVDSGTRMVSVCDAVSGDRVFAASLDVRPTARVAPHTAAAAVFWRHEGACAQHPVHALLVDGNHIAVLCAPIPLVLVFHVGTGALVCGTDVRVYCPRPAGAGLSWTGLALARQLGAASAAAAAAAAAAVPVPFTLRPPLPSPPPLLVYGSGAVVHIPLW